MYQTVFIQHAELLKALAHPKRLEIIQLLRNHAFNVSEIQQMLGLPQANISQHLMILRQFGVVKTLRQGKEITYQLSHPNFLAASDLMRAVLIERMKKTSKVQPKELKLNMLDLVPLVQDPVCGMRLSPKTASYEYEYQGKQYFFCAEGCLKQFKKKPKQFLHQ